jgi:hypothetical protein
LKGSTQEWFRKLLSKSIDNLKFLERQFLTQLLVVRKRKKSPSYLLSLTWGKNESLKDYMIRFNRAKLGEEKPKEEMVMAALMNGIKIEGKLMAE